MSGARPIAVVGLLGGVASGKSTVAARLAERGFLVLDADAEARAATDEPAVRAALVERFGAAIEDADGRLDRAELARRAFADAAGTRDLNAIVHPRVRERLAAALDANAAARRPRPVVLDVPLLMESPLADLVTTWVFVDADETARDARAAARAWGPGERERREALQATLAAKRARADHVLENSGSMGDLEREVDALVRTLGDAATP